MADDRVTLREGARILGGGIRREPWVFTASLLGSATFGVVTVLSASVIGHVSDTVITPAFTTGTTTSRALLGAAALLIGVALVKAAAIVVRRLFAGIMQFRLAASDRRRVTRQYLRLPLSWHQRHPTGELLSNANADVEATWAPVAPMPMAFGVVVMLVVALAAMVAADPALGAVGLVIFPMVMLVNVAYQRRMAPLASRAQALRAEVSAIAHESFDGALVVKSLGRESEETARFASAAHELRDVNARVGRLRGMFDPVIESLPTIGVLAVLLIGSQRVASGQITAGTVVQVAYLLTVIAFPVRAIGWLLGEMPRSVVGWRRVDRVLQATGVMPYGDATLEGTEPVTARAAGLSYGYDERDVLRDLELSVAPGKVLAVVGSTGVGKSTLVSLLVRLVDPRAGQVVLDDVDVRDLAGGVIPGASAVVLQQAFLFDDSVRGNVTLGADYTDDEVWRALRLAQADSFVSVLPVTLDTRIGERGTSLSGGQRQRLALARAIIRRPRLLVLDDATSAVDPEVEQRILEGLRTSADGITVVVVAHRPATIAVADEVAYLSDGAVVEHGTHLDLLARNSDYRALVTAYETEQTAGLTLGPAGLAVGRSS